MRGFVLLAALTAPCAAVEERTAANPIRKVVTMLQMMQKKVTTEGEKEQDMFDKFMCYCKNGVGDLEKSISEAEAKAGELPSEIEGAEAELTQLKEDLKKAQTDRVAAKEAIAEATAIREKEAAEYAAASGDLKRYVADIGKAVDALRKGLGGAFLQTAAASTLKTLVETDQKMLDVDREDLTSFLSESEGTQNADAIVGILEQMRDRMGANLAELTGTEEESIKAFDTLIAAKTKEIEALTASIEDKTQRIGDLGVQIVGMKDDLADVSDSLLDDKKFLAELQKSCATKEKEWAEICKLRSEELLALADTIKILNDDDALELFKKTLPGASSFLQVQVSAEAMRAQALSLLQAAKGTKKGDRHRLDFIMMAVRGKKVGFDKILKMIDDMVALLKEEQVDDDNKKEYCEAQFDTADDKKKGLERSVGKLEKAIDEAKETIATLTDEIKSLEEGVVALDKSVAEATVQRKEENSDYTTLVASNSAAKEILAFAKNRLNKFYNPKLYKAPPAATPELIQRGAPGPPPETAKAYSKKSGESGGVIAMVDTLIKELDTEITEAEVNEKNAQEEYEEMMADSAAKRAADSKSLSQKAGAKADTEKALVDAEADKTSTAKELMATIEYISQLHGECDWLIKYFDVRKEARSGEVGALGKAKAVLSGADFSLVQTKSHKFLRRA